MTPRPEESQHTHIALEWAGPCARSHGRRCFAIVSLSRPEAPSGVRRPNANLLARYRVCAAVGLMWVLDGAAHMGVVASMFCFLWILVLVSLCCLEVLKG